MYGSITTSALGVATYVEECGGATLSYRDVIAKGSCALGYDKIISRYWIVVDASGNRDTCIQTIRVNYVPLSAVVFPEHFDGLALPGHTSMLSCDAKIDKTKDVSSHFCRHQLVLTIIW